MSEISMEFKNLEATAPIGVFDSGVGGLTVLKELKRQLPHERFIYLGDTARTPYGTRGRETILRYSCECADFLTRLKVKLLIVACNTASSVALPTLTKSSPTPVIGTINEAVAIAAKGSPRGKVAVIGTEATISSNVYQDALKLARPDLVIGAAACPLFVPLVEQGMFDGEIVDRIVELYLAPLRGAGVDTVVLGCTHYPLLKDAIDKFFESRVLIVECSKAVALEAEALLTARGMLAESANGGDVYYVTDGVTKFNSLGGLFMRNGPVNASKVEL